MRFGRTAAFLLLLAGSLPAFASAPVLSNIVPRGGQRGTEVDVKFVGQRLEDAQQVMIYQPGIEVVSFTVVNGGEATAKLKIAPECQLGVKHMRIRCASGMSDMRTFRVGALPTVAEKEPNNDFKQPQPVDLNVTVEGIVQSEDVEYFVVEVKQGQRITAEIEGIRLGNTMFDPYISIMNEARFELSASDDAALLMQDGVASIIAPADGKYIVQLRESSFGGNGACHYRCHIGTFPRPVGMVPSGGRPGETVEVKFLGEAAGDAARSITLPADFDPDYALFLQDEAGISPSGMKFRLSPLPNVIEQEPNNAIAEAAKNQAPAAFNGVLSQKGDVDIFGFTATKGQVFDIAVFGRRLRSEIDSVLVILNAQGGGVASNDDQGGPDSNLRFTAPADGDFFIHVRDHLNRGGAGFFYRVEVSPVAPKLDLSVNEFVQYIEPKMAVPQGNRIPLLINAQRRDFGGPLQFLTENLPTGVALESFGLAADQSVAQVILAAAPDAAVAGSFGKIIGKLNDPNQPLPIQDVVDQPVVMVRGQNNIPFFTESVRGLPVAVAEKVPFRLEIVEPKAPLVQSGSMQLKVIAHREGEFKAPIKIELVLNPPGVNSSRETSIPEGQTEALISINAAGNAQVGEHKICVRGEATVGNGPVMICSPFASLKVTEPYLKFNFQAAAVELGQSTELLVKVEQLKPFEGQAQVALLGLPNKVTTGPLELNKDLTEIAFKIAAEADAAPGNTKNLLCQVTLMEQGEPVVHSLGSGALRIDKPLPPKPMAAAPMPMPNPAPAPAAAAPAPKRLTRLEQLRLEQQQKQSGASAPANP